MVSTENPRPARPAPGPPTMGRSGSAYRIGRTVGWSVLYCAALPPVALAASGGALLGRPATAAAWWRSLSARLPGGPEPVGQGSRGPGRPEPVGPASRPGWARFVTHDLLSLLLAAVALIPLGCLVLFVARGVLYGIVDPGPYDHSWGGPGRAGAWLAHFLVGVPIMLAALGAATGLAALHRRLTRWMDERPTGRWLIPVTLLIGLAGGLLFVAWLRQI